LDLNPALIRGYFVSAIMNIVRANATATKRGPAGYFTGAVWQDEVSLAPPGSGVQVVVVTFEPGARTTWHTHPNGQLLQITSGVGRVQKAGEKMVEVLPGDVIWFEPGERHWHGAAPNRKMVHLAVQRVDEGGNVATWMERVTEAEYSGA
jgi:quercetin dioxygenase-like cupin family protein